MFIFLYWDILLSALMPYCVRDLETWECVHCSRKYPHKEKNWLDCLQIVSHFCYKHRIIFKLFSISRRQNPNKLKINQLYCCFLWIFFFNIWHVQVLLLPEGEVELLMTFKAILLLHLYGKYRSDWTYIRIRMAAWLVLEGSCGSCCTKGLLPVLGSYSKEKARNRSDGCSPTAP